MAKLIKDRRLVEDSYVLIKEKDIQSVEDLPDAKALILPLKVWNRCGHKLADRQVGVWLDCDEPPALLESDINAIPVIAINFPVFSDGRGYSYARTLRDQRGYTGELRAIGDVLRDQLFYLQRCGFNSFIMREQDKSDEAIVSLADFKESYQAAADNPIPLFRRR